MVRVAQAPVSYVEGSLVLLPVSGKGVLAHVDRRGLLHRVDQEVADCRVGCGVCEGGYAVHCYRETITCTLLPSIIFLHATTLGSHIHNV
jgi:hypothetical protein